MYHGDGCVRAADAGGGVEKNCYENFPVRKVLRDAKKKKNGPNKRGILSTILSSPVVFLHFCFDVLSGSTARTTAKGLPADLLLVPVVFRVVHKILTHVSHPPRVFYPHFNLKS